LATNNTFLDDRESLEILVNQLHPAAREDYRSYTSLSAESCFPGRKMVVYTLKNGKPTDIEILHFGQMWMPEYKGPMFEVSSDRHKEPTSIGLTPVKLWNREIYLSAPQKFELRWRGKRVRDEVHFAPHYMVLIKSRSKPHLNVNGDTYCVRFNQFMDQFPDVDLNY
jgi:hypothetical protein